METHSLIVCKLKPKIIIGFKNTEIHIMQYENINNFNLTNLAKIQLTT